MATLHQSWPLLGVAVSGIGIVCPSHILDAWNSLPDIPSISLPSDVKRQVMFGPATSYDVEARELCMSDDCPIPRPELMEIAFGWPKNFAPVAAKINAPVHYRHAQFEGLWEANQKTISDVRAALRIAAAQRTGASGQEQKSKTDTKPFGQPPSSVLHSYGHHAL